jgi:hypothetical protein
MPRSESSRPYPECCTPPNGASFRGVEPRIVGGLLRLHDDPDGAEAGPEIRRKNFGGCQAADLRQPLGAQRAAISATQRSEDWIALQSHQWLVLAV